MWHPPADSPISIAFSRRDLKAIGMVLEKATVGYCRWGTLVVLAVDKAGWKDVEEVCREVLGEDMWKSRMRVKNAHKLRGRLPKPMEAKDLLRGARKAEVEMGSKGSRWAYVLGHPLR